MPQGRSLPGRWTSLQAIARGTALAILCFATSAGLARASKTITASAGLNGEINPSGAVVVSDGGSQTFRIRSNANSKVQDVLVDGLSVGAMASYTFSAVNAPHTISASFAVDTTLSGWIMDGLPAAAATNHQMSPSMCPDGTGGVFLAWQDKRSGGYDIYMQRLNANGAALWTSNGVPISTAANDQLAPQVISDGAGGAIVVWTDHRTDSGDIYAQRVNVSGDVQWTANGVPLCTAAATEDQPALATDGAAGAIVAWRDARVNMNTNIYAQRIGGNGAVQWTGNGVPICTASGVQAKAVVAASDLGGAVLAWQDHRGSSEDIYTQRIRANGTVTWTADGVALVALPNDQTSSSLIAYAGGGAIVTWDDLRLSTNQNIYAQRVDSTGAAQWTANGAAVDTQPGIAALPAIVSDGGTGAIIVWQGLPTRVVDQAIVAQRIDATGATQWSAGGVDVCTASGVQSNPIAVADGSSGAFFAWSDARVAPARFYSQRMNGFGVAQWAANGVQVSPSASTQSAIPMAASDQVDGMMIAWPDDRAGSSNFDVYVQHVASTGAVGFDYTVTVAPPSHGHVIPGTIGTWGGSSQRFDFIREQGYSLSSVVVDGGSVGAPSSYTFTNLAANHQLTVTFSAKNPPVITSFSPLSGPILSSVIISGTGFSATPAEDIVYFGGVRATVTSADTTSLTVTVPAGASYAPLSVTVESLTGRSRASFATTFPGAGVVTAGLLGPVADVTGPLTPRPEVIAESDLDLDGKQDLVYAADDHRIYALRNTSTTNATSYAAPLQLGVTHTKDAFALGDVDGDGKLDVVFSGNHVLSVLRNTSSAGTISFSSPLDLVMNNDAGAIAIADLDGDGRSEVMSDLSGHLLVWRNLGGDSLTFSTSQQISSMNLDGVRICAGDVDGDQKPDVVGTNNNQVFLARNTSSPGTISFAVPTTLTTVWGQANDLALGDLDLDGKSDLVGAGPASGVAGALVFRNTSTVGSVSFDAAIPLGTGSQPAAISLASLDGDGRADLALAVTNADSLEVFQNTSSPGSLSFASRVDFSTRDDPRGVVLTDANGDGRVDVAIAEGNARLISVLQNNGSYAIVASAGSGGTISPSGSVVVVGGATTSFTITPNVGYHVQNLTVDDSSVGAPASYSFTNVNANHTIAASFAAGPTTVAAQSDVVLPSGALYGFLIGPSSFNRGYVAEISPSDTGRTGQTLQQNVIHPEYGTLWNDVLRLQTLPTDSALAVNIRVYSTDGLPVVSNFNTTLSPGVLQGFPLGSSDQSRGFIAEVSPDADGANGQTLQRNVIEPEFDGEHWNDVLRLQAFATDPSLPVNVRVYDTTGLPIVADFSTTLQPGVLHGFALGSSNLDRAYVAEVTPASDVGTAGETLQRNVIEPEFDGSTWNDVLRLQIQGMYAPLDVNVRVYALTSPPKIFSCLPSHGGNAGELTATILGHNLWSGATVKLQRSGKPDVVGTQVTVSANGESLSTRFDLFGKAIGNWTPVVINPDGRRDSLLGGFRVDSLAAPQLHVSILRPDPIRAQYATAFDLVVENQGNVDARSVPVWVAGIPLDATVSLDFSLAPPPQTAGEPDWSTVPLTFTSPGGQYLAVVIPNVPPGTVSRRIRLTVPSSDPQFQLTAALTPPWTSDLGLVGCLNGGGITNPSCTTSQLTAINGYLAANPQLEALSGIGLWAKVAWQCEGAASLPAALSKAEQVMDFLEQPVESGTAPGGCGDALLPRWRQTRPVNVVFSIDPNDKLGPQGTLSSQQGVGYSVRFENQSTSTAWTRQVTIVDPLATSLDLSSVSLDQISFGDVRLLPAPGMKQYTHDVDLGHDNLLVRVSASLDLPSRQLTWLFTTLDKSTLQPPSNGTLGFLPPNDALHHGEGSVLFTVRPMPNATLVQNSALIDFHDSPPLSTPQVSNAVDNQAPSSNVLPLSTPIGAATFPVAWQASGSPPDLKDFTVYVAEDGGPYTVWKQNTLATTDTYVPRPGGHTYSFYSEARDVTGNVESAPSAPDAQTLSTTAVEDGVSGMLALAGAQPNPAQGVLRVTFTLASRERAVLELLDVAGRRVLRHEVGALGPGRHVWKLEPAPGLPAGLYFLRLAQGKQALQARVVLIR